MDCETPYTLLLIFECISLSNDVSGIYFGEVYCNELISACWLFGTSLRHRFSVYRSKTAIGFLQPRKACKHVKLFSFVRLQLTYEDFYR